MKIAAFSVRPDEKQYFDTFANVYKVELQINRSGFTADDIESVKGCEAMSVCDGMCDLSAPVLEKLAAEGVKYIGFRTIGYNSVDLEAAKAPWNPCCTQRIFAIFSCQLYSNAYAYVYRKVCMNWMLIRHTAIIHLVL